MMKGLPFKRTYLELGSLVVTVGVAAADKDTAAVPLELDIAAASLELAGSTDFDVLSAIIAVVRKLTNSN